MPNDKKSAVDVIKFRPIQVWLQIILMIITAGVIAYSMYHATTFFTSSDSLPKLQKFTPQSLEHFGGNSSIISTGMYIKNFVAFDPIKNDFIFNGVVWFEYDPEVVTLLMLSKFAFERAEILEKSEPDLRNIGGKFFAEYTVRVRFKNFLSYSYFPFDDHRVNIQLINTFLVPSESIFESNQASLVVDASVSALGWNRVNQYVQNGFIEIGIKEERSINNIYYPSVVYSIDYMRIGVRYALTILLPLLAIFFVTLLAFSVNVITNSMLAITLSTGGVTATIAYRFVIENFSPAVGYFMVSDYIYFLFLFLVSIVFIIANIMPKLVYVQKLLLLITLHCMISGAIMYLLFYYVGSL